MKSLLRHRVHLLALLLASLFVCVALVTLLRVWRAYAYMPVFTDALELAVMVGVFATAVAVWVWCWWQFVKAFAARHRSN